MKSFENELDSLMEQEIYTKSGILIAKRIDRILPIWGEDWVEILEHDINMDALVIPPQEWRLWSSATLYKTVKDNVTIICWKGIDEYLWYGRYYIQIKDVYTKEGEA